MNLDIPEIATALAALQSNLEAILEYLGAFLAGILGLNVIGDRLWGLGLAVSLVLVFAIATLINLVLSYFSKGRKDGARKLQEQDAEDMRKAQKLKRHHELEMLKAEHTREKRRTRDEQANLAMERKALTNFSTVTFLQKAADLVAATLIAILARRKGEVFLAAHLARHHQRADSLYRANVIRSVTRVQNASDQVRFHTRDLEHKLIKAESDHSFLDGVIRRAEENIERFKSPDHDEEQVAEIHNRWRKILQRPLFRESFQSFFERNLEQWNRSLGQEELKSAVQFGSQQAEGPSSQLRSRSIWERTKQWLWADFSNALRLFLFLAVPAELMFTYPIFLALSNGDKLAAVAGATVFTFGILTLGQMTGKSILRMRSRKPGSESKSDSVITEWRTFSVIAMIMLVFVAFFGIYAGSTLRQNAGEVLRISQEVQALGVGIEAASRRLERLQSDTTSNAEQIEAVEGLIERLESQRNEQISSRNEIVKRTDSPFLTSEGRAALFIFGIFFLGSVASQIFKHDPVYEYSQSSRDLAVLSETREQKRLIAENSKLAFEAIKQDLGRHIKSLKSEIEASETNVDAQALMQNTKKSLKVLRQQIHDYVRARGSAFSAYLAAFGCIDVEAAERVISEHENRRASDDAAQYLEE